MFVNQCLCFLLVRAQLLEHCTFNCNLLHVLAICPTSDGLSGNIHGKEYRGRGRPLGILFHVFCKIYLVMAKRPKYEVDYNLMYSLLKVVFVLTIRGLEL